MTHSFLRILALAMTIGVHASAQVHLPKGPTVAISNDSSKLWFINFPMLPSEAGDPLYSLHIHVARADGGPIEGLATSKVFLKRGGDTFEIAPNRVMTIIWENTLRAVGKGAPPETERSFSIADHRSPDQPDLPRAWFHLHAGDPITVDTNRTNVTALNKIMTLTPSSKVKNATAIEIKAAAERYAPPPPKAP